MRKHISILCWFSANLVKNHLQRLDDRYDNDGHAIARLRSLLPQKFKSTSSFCKIGAIELQPPGIGQIEAITEVLSKEQPKRVMGTLRIFLRPSLGITFLCKHMIQLRHLLNGQIRLLPLLPSRYRNEIVVLI